MSYTPHTTAHPAHGDLSFDRSGRVWLRFNATDGEFEPIRQDELIVALVDKVKELEVEVERLRNLHER